MARAFVIRPFDKKADSKGRQIDFEEVHRTLIQPALLEAGLTGSTTGEIIDAGNVREDMFSLILGADLVVADISLHNANVFYELGMRHALRRRHTVLIREAGSADSPPFDLLTDRYLKYTLGSDESRRQLVEMIRSSLQATRETDSPVFKMLPTLPEAGRSSMLPRDFQEEVQRARAAKSKGWLRLLAEDVRGSRFEWAALELIGKGQLDLQDLTGARDTWESIRAIHSDNAAADLALANVYERLSRDSSWRSDEAATFLALSDQAIDRVLASPGASGQRVEALALQGRNQKTRWRAEFSKVDPVTDRRCVAMNRPLRQSFEAYRNAFREDLNHFWSGLAALQMGTIFLELSRGDDTSWKTAFDDDDQADAYRRGVDHDVTAMRTIVAASVEGALLRMPANHPDRPWAAVSKADTLFLSVDNAPRVIATYRDALTGQGPFVKDAARGQLLLFAQLAVRDQLAEKVIQMIDAQPAASVPAPTNGAPRPLLAVLFAGHRVDAPGRADPRFPASRAVQAKAAIVEALRKLSAEYEVLGMASGASGGDILFHEACAELGIRSVLCLPFRMDRYAAEEFGTLDDWRSRFLVLSGKSEVRELSDCEALPRWLHGTQVDAWERGNRWTLQMALTSGARKVALLALWDGKDGDARGGTAHMVRLARQAGTVDITILDATRLPP
jgi:hypothetical protein